MLLVAAAAIALVVGVTFVGVQMRDAAAERAVNEVGINVDEEVDRWEDAFASATWGSPAPNAEQEGNSARPPSNASTSTTTETFAAPNQSLSEMSIYDFLVVSRENQINYSKDELASMRQASYTFLFGSGSLIENPSINDSPQTATERVVRIIAADMYTASAVGKTDQQEGAKLLASIIDPTRLRSYFNQISDNYIGPGKQWPDARGSVESTTGYQLVQADTYSVSYTKIGNADNQRARFTAVKSAESSGGSPIFSLIAADSV